MITLFSNKKQLSDEEFSTLFRSTYPHLYRLAYSLLNEPEDSRDVVNDVFTNLLDKHKMTAEVNEGYLMAMVRNRAIDFLRHHQVEDEARADLIREYRLYMVPDHAHEERIKEIRRFIETELTPQTCKVLQLCYDEKRSYQEAATELGVSVQADNKHISQALRKLREHFNAAID